MTQQTIIQLNESDFDNRLKDISKKMLLENCYSRKISTPAVAEILGVTTQTVSLRVRNGKLLPLNPGSSKYWFRLSDVLQLVQNEKRYQ